MLKQLTVKVEYQRNVPGVHRQVKTYRFKLPKWATVNTAIYPEWVGAQLKTRPAHVALLADHHMMAMRFNAYPVAKPTKGLIPVYGPDPLSWRDHAREHGKDE